MRLIFLSFLISILATPAFAQEIRLMEAMRMKMAYMSQRQSILANNIANANTPHFIPSDLAQTDFNKKMPTNQQAKLAMAVTNQGHIRKPGSEFGSFKAHREKNMYESTPQGNQVVLEEQAMKVAENNSDYQLTVNLYKQMGGMLKTAIGGR